MVNLFGAGVAGAGSGVASSGAAALSAVEVRPHWSVLQEAPHRGEGEQGDHGAGDVCLRLPPALGQLLDAVYWLSPVILSSIHPFVLKVVIQYVLCEPRHSYLCHVITVTKITQ